MASRFIRVLWEKMQFPFGARNSEKQTKKNVASGLPAYERPSQAANFTIGTPDYSDAKKGHNSMKLKSFGITDVGLKRTHNEDSFYRSDEHGIYIVADGMGGHAAGEVASKSTVASIVEFVEKFASDPTMTWPFGFDIRLTDEGNALLSGIQLANHTLVKMQQQKPELSGMGTTVAALRITANQALLAHVGDSRIYRIRDNAIELLTNDHSWVNEQLLKKLITPEEARTHRYRNVITRALGNRTDLEIDVRLEAIEPGDCFLVCSDGLSGMMDDQHMLEIFQQNTDVRAAANLLVARANEAGGHDNISVVLVACSSD